jgi:hypothetical protein
MMQVTVKRMYAPQQPLQFDLSGGGSTTVATLLNKIHDRLGWCLADLRLLRGGTTVQSSHVIGTDIPAGTEFVLVLNASWRKRASDAGIAMGTNNETFSSVSSMNDYQQEVEKHRKRFVEKREAEAAAARLEAARLEAARLEAARLEAARLEATRLEAARLEAAEAEHNRNMERNGIPLCWGCDWCKDGGLMYRK